MKKFSVEVSHTEYATIDVMANNEHEAEKNAIEKIDYANWGNSETEIVGVEEIIKK